jgi:transposase
MSSQLSHLSRSELETLVVDQARVITLLEARIEQLETGLGSGGGVKKTSRNSHRPPSRDEKGNSGSGGKCRKARPSRPGVSRRLAANPDEVIGCRALLCEHCGSDVAGQVQGCRQAYDHVEIPPLVPHVTRIELFGGRCGNCGRRFKALPPEGMTPGTPFGPTIHALLLYLHHSHHVGFERLARAMGELFGLAISEGAIANAFTRMVEPLNALRRSIKARLRGAAVIASDETTTRINGVTHWHWVFCSKDAILHEIAPRRAKAVAEGVLDNHRPEVWVSDRYAGQQDLAATHQVCLAHVLRDVQYAIDSGDEAFAPKLRDLLRWTIGIGQRRDHLKDSTLASYLARAESRLDNLLAVPAAHKAGRKLQRQTKAWRTKLFVFMTDRRVPATNNISEREVRPSVVFRKVTGGFRSDDGADAHAGYRTLTSTAGLSGRTPLDAVSQFVVKALSGRTQGQLMPTT